MVSSAGSTAFDVLIVGGGNAGVSAAARLNRNGIRDVAIVEPNAVHTYRPLLSYVGGGQASIRSAERTQRSVTPKGCRWLHDAVVAVDADSRVVHCASGAVYGYRDLILGAGLEPDTDALPGLDTAIQSPSVTSNYLDYAEKTWQLVRSMRDGQRAIFTVPRPPVSCTGTTLKPLFLAAAHWKRAKRDVAMTLAIDRPQLVGVPGLDGRLYRALAEFGVKVVRGAVTAVRPDTARIILSGIDSEEIAYDMLHLVPPFRGPRWVAESGLADGQPLGLVDVDPATFSHRRYSGVWAIGDGAAVDTDPSGGALRRQVAIMVDNLLAARSGEVLAEYDGYTVAPVAVDSHSLIAAEFDRSGGSASSLPSFIDPFKPRRIAWAFDRYGLPQIYWNLILNGRV